mmetsp:Transcript_9975/g.28342  ORF Transcript_9975/g.28342 Transcript_9975/m.28342 type:complete len:264 (-) Transcript_9975:165-956(-)
MISSCRLTIHISAHCNDDVVAIVDVDADIGVNVAVIANIVVRCHGGGRCCCSSSCNTRIRHGRSAATVSCHARVLGEPLLLLLFLSLLLFYHRHGQLLRLSVSVRGTTGIGLSSYLCLLFPHHRQRHFLPLTLFALCMLRLILLMVVMRTRCRRSRGVWSWPSFWSAWWSFCRGCVLGVYLRTACSSTWNRRRHRLCVFRRWYSYPYSHCCVCFRFSLCHLHRLFQLLHGYLDGIKSFRILLRPWQRFESRFTAFWTTDHLMR